MHIDIRLDIRYPVLDSGPARRTAHRMEFQVQGPSGHYFEVVAAMGHVDEPEPALLSLKLEDSSADWQISLQLLSSVASACMQLTELREVVQGSRARVHGGKDASAMLPGSSRYNFCLIFDGAEPLLLSTRSDAERAEVMVAISAAKAGSLPPSMPTLRSGPLTYERVGGTPIACVGAIGGDDGHERARGRCER